MLAVTGSTGFLGSYLLPRLGTPYRALVRKPEKAREGSQDIVGDLENIFDINRLVDGTSGLLHMACTTNPRSSNRDMAADLSQNLIPSVRLFEAFYKQNPKGRIIFFSTGGAMYDPLHHTKPIPETATAQPWSSYAIHKLALEQYLAMQSHQSGGSATILRISNPYGVLLPSQRGQGLIGVALSHLLESKTLSIIESPHSVRDYIHIDDLLSAVKLVLEKPSTGLQLYHVGSGTGSSIEHIVTTIEKVTGKKLPTKLTAPATANVTYNALDRSKIEHDLGFKPQISLEEGLQRLWQEISKSV